MMSLETLNEQQEKGLFWIGSGPLIRAFHNFTVLSPPFQWVSAFPTRNGPT